MHIQFDECIDLVGKIIRNAIDEKDIGWLNSKSEKEGSFRWWLNILGLGDQTEILSIAKQKGLI